MTDCPQPAIRRDPQARVPEWSLSTFMSSNRCSRRAGARRLGSPDGDWRDVAARRRANRADKHFRKNTCCFVSFRRGCVGAAAA